MSKLRERFEADWSKQYGIVPDYQFPKKADGEYFDFGMQTAWELYQAALEPVRELVEKWDTAVNRMSKHTTNSVECGQVLMLDACRDELAKLLEE